MLANFQRIFNLCCSNKLIGRTRKLNFMQHITSWNQNLQGSSRGYSTEEHWTCALIIDPRLSQDIDTNWLWPHICFSFLCWSDTSQQDFFPKPAPVSPPCNILCLKLRLTIILGQQHHNCIHSFHTRSKEKSLLIISSTVLWVTIFSSGRGTNPSFFLCALYLLITKGAQLHVPLCSGSSMHESTKHIQAIGG